MGFFLKLWRRIKIGLTCFPRLRHVMISWLKSSHSSCFSGFKHCFRITGTLFQYALYTAPAKNHFFAFFLLFFKKKDVYVPKLPDPINLKSSSLPFINNFSLTCHILSHCMKRETTTTHVGVNEFF